MNFTSSAYDQTYDILLTTRCLAVSGRLLRLEGGVSKLKPSRLRRAAKYSDVDGVFMVDQSHIGCA